MLSTHPAAGLVASQRLRSAQAMAVQKHTGVRSPHVLIGRCYASPDGQADINSRTAKNSTTTVCALQAAARTSAFRAGNMERRRRRRRRKTQTQTHGSRLLRDCRSERRHTQGCDAMQRRRFRTARTLDAAAGYATGPHARFPPHAARGAEESKKTSQPAEARQAAMCSEQGRRVGVGVCSADGRPTFVACVSAAR
jgi:hypothetical protein